MSKVHQDTLWINYLRSIITVLVIVHHAALSYTTFANFHQEAYILSTHAVVDNSRWIGLDVLVNFNDIYFMSLMFLIGGLFLPKSIRGKGIAVFLKDRFFRLFIPFILGGTCLMLIAYYPSYLLATGKTTVTDYVLDFFTTQSWPVGPPWFIWVLFAFNVLFAVLYLLGHLWMSNMGKFLTGLGQKPILFFVFLFLFTWLMYVPLTLLLGTSYWTGLGPFDFQLNRVLLYFGYFMLGVFIGNTDFKAGIFSPSSRWLGIWKIWILLALLVFILITLVPDSLRRLVEEQRLSSTIGWTIYNTLFVLSCVSSSLAFLAVFRMCIHASKSWWDSLSENAYMIYLCHFVFVTWSQYLFLDFALPAFVKFFLVCIVSLMGSWALSIWLRKIPLIKKYI